MPPTTPGSPHTPHRSSRPWPSHARPGSATSADTTLADKIADAALDEPLSLRYLGDGDGEMGEPKQLRRRDGASVYTRHGATTYTSQELLTAERRIVAAAQQQG